MTDKEKELEYRSQCPYFWKKDKNLGTGVCMASAHAHYADELCYPCDDCFWMKEWKKENGQIKNHNNE